MATVAVTAQKLLERTDQMVWRLSPTQNENGPAQCAGDQSTCRLVDVQVVLECNQQVPENEDEDKEGGHVGFRSDDLFESDRKGS